MTTRHPTARRVHRPDTEPDDAFVAGVLESSVWMKQHQRTLIIAGVTAAVIIIGLVLWLNHRSNQRARANLELTQVRAVAMSGNTALAIRDLQQFLSSYGGTPAADEARLLLGRVYMEAGQPQQAIETVQQQGRRVRGDMGTAAAFMLGAAHEAAQQLQEAEQTYIRIGDGARFLYQRQEGLDNAARLRLQRGDAAGAVQLYERLLRETPETSPERQVFQLRLGEARALALNPQQPQTVPAAPPPQGAMQAPGDAAPPPGETPGAPAGQTPAAPEGQQQPAPAPAGPGSN
jgi:predicted negative regulator of RcsB-dependent stress response